MEARCRVWKIKFVIVQFWLIMKLTLFVWDPFSLPPCLSTCLSFVSLLYCLSFIPGLICNIHLMLKLPWLELKSCHFINVAKIFIYKFYFFWKKKVWEMVLSVLTVIFIYMLTYVGFLNLTVLLKYFMLFSGQNIPPPL